MTDELATVARAFDDHDAFEELDASEDRDDEWRFELSTTPFSARVRLARNGTVSVTVVAPMLSAAVAGDAVAPVVEDGWFETFERRLEDASMALEDEDVVEPTVVADGDDLRVETSLDADDPRRTAENAKAFAEYVEGTYMEGVIPGYEYTEPVASMRSRAYDNT